MARLPTPTNDRTLNMNLPSRLHSKVHIPIRRSSPRRRRLSKRRCIQHGDVSRGRLARRIRNDLKVPRDEPILVDDMVGFGRDDVDAEVVVVTVGEDGDERGEVDEVVWKVECAVGCDRSPCCGDDSTGEDDGVSDNPQSELDSHEENS